jgi:hypothetical protein
MWKRVLELLDCGVAEPGNVEVQEFEPGQTLNVFQTFVSDLGVLDVSSPESVALVWLRRNARG